jgi:hypothetical protein
MRKSRNQIRKRRISKRRRSIYGGQIDEIRSCPNELEPKFKWKYGDNCYASCDATRDKTFPVSWDDDHDQRTCEADTPSNRQRYNYLRRLPSTAYKGYRVGRDAAVAVKDAAVAAKDTAVSAFNYAAPYAVAAKDTAVSAFNFAAPYAVAAKDKAVKAYKYVAPSLFPSTSEEEEEEFDLN